MGLLGKIDRYKEAIDELRPFEGDLLSQIKNYYRIGLTWASNALEGNTLTESETKVLLEDGLTVGGRPPPPPPPMMQEGPLRAFFCV